jgi:hypothetical protein
MVVRMNPMQDTVIVSAFGRGDWLAAELAGRGFKVTLLDVSNALGTWASEDIEGPFGFFEAPDLLPSQKARLEEESFALKSGFTFWLNDGPLECEGPLTRFQLDARGVPSAVESYLRSDSPTQRERDAILAKFPFSAHWLGDLAHQVTSLVFNENHRAMEAVDTPPAPVFRPFRIRQTSSRTLARSFTSCEAAGVDVDRRARAEGLDHANKNLNSVAGKAARTFVIALSGLETQSVLGEDAAAALFPKGILRPVLSWTRFRVDLRGPGSDERIPAHSVLIEDLNLPWTHENLIILRRRAQPKAYDAWLRLPLHAQSDGDYLKSAGIKIQNTLQRRIPLLEPFVVESQPGVAPVGVYSDEERGAMKFGKFTNAFFCGPESWVSIDWNGCFRAQAKIIDQLEKLRAQWVAAEERAAQKARKKAEAERSATP